MRRLFISVLEIVEIAAIAIAAVFVIRTFLVQPFLVIGASMSPNFEDGDYLLVDEVTYRFREPQRGEVAVFRYPNDESTFFIKRIIGLPGERVVIRDGGVAIMNGSHPQGFALDESYLRAEVRTSGEQDVTLGKDQYFLLGDNRPYSFDSRSWGVLSRDEMVGIARVRLWPPKNLSVFAAPQY